MSHPSGMFFHAPAENIPVSGDHHTHICVKRQSAMKGLKGEKFTCPKSKQGRRVELKPQHCSNLFQDEEFELTKCGCWEMLLVLPCFVILHQELARDFKSLLVPAVAYTCFDLPDDALSWGETFTPLRRETPHRIHKIYLSFSKFNYTLYSNYLISYYVCFIKYHTSYHISSSYFWTGPNKPTNPIAHWQSTPWGTPVHLICLHEILRPDVAVPCCTAIPC